PRWRGGLRARRYARPCLRRYANRRAGAPRQAAQEGRRATPSCTTWCDTRHVTKVAPIRDVQHAERFEHRPPWLSHRCGSPRAAGPMEERRGPMTSSAPLGLQGAYLQGERAEHDELRSRLLDVAVDLLVTDGPASLTIRRIATEAACTPPVTYTMFGNREGLAEALYLEGFERIRRRLDRVSQRRDPMEYLNAIVLAYRKACLAEPGYYSLMFERA